MSCSLSNFVFKSHHLFQVTRQYSSFFARHSDIPTSTIVKTGQTVSRLGFGGYRINRHNPHHKEALISAIKQGINVIDTATTFEGGESEKLIGLAVKEAESLGICRWSDLVVITKAGYIHPTQWGSPNSKAIHNHCIHPDFIQNEITESLRRLQTDKIDIFMLNNPERMLLNPNKTYSMNRLYNEIAETCTYLDEECAKGRIGGYGICSNLMALPSSNDNISFPSILSKLSPQSRQNFVAIETPFNIFEREAIWNDGGEKTLAELAELNEVFLFTNRPFHTIAGGTIRTLVTSSGEVEPEQVFAKLEGNFEKLSQLETELNEQFPVETSLQSKFVWAQVLSENLTRLSKNHFATKHYLEKDIKPAIERDLAALADYASVEVFDEEKVRLKTWIDDYRTEAKDLIDNIIDYARIDLLLKNQDLDAVLSLICPSLISETDHFHSPLSAKALRIILANSRVGCALVGMRRVEYVNDAITVLKLSIDDEMTVERLDDIYQCPALQ